MTISPGKENEAVLPENVPVAMPDLPPTLRVHTAQQFKAVGDATRSRILQMIKHEPLTAKQLGEQLNITPGTISHHLHVLDAAGLAQIVARRLVHNIVVKYYTRTARLFLFDFPQEVEPTTEHSLSFLTRARDELADALMAGKQGQQEALAGEKVGDLFDLSFPHTQLSPEQAADFDKRLRALIYEFATAKPGPNGKVYALCIAFFPAPPSLQGGAL